MGLITIGLVGGIAAGKSEVARLLSEHGALVLDADRLAHAAYEPGSEGFQALVRAFGESIVAQDGSIDRRALGSVAFGDPQKLRQLTDIVWPLTRRIAEQRMAEARAGGVEVLVLEAPLLIEAGWRDMVDEVWLVRAPLAEVRRRLRGRGLDEAAIEARLAARDRLAEAEAAATLIIENDGDLAALAARVDEGWRSLQRVRETEAGDSKMKKT